jgi:type IV pilus assembly protein PilX
MKFPLSSTRAATRQRGVVLLLCLIVLVILLAGGVAVVRSMNTSLTSAGNLAFRRDLVNQGERAVSVVLAEFSSNGALVNATDDVPAQNFKATKLENNTAGRAAGAAGRQGIQDCRHGRQRPQADAGAQVSIRYVIDRLCSSTGPATSTGCVQSSAAPAGGTASPTPLTDATHRHDLPPEPSRQRPARHAGVHAVDVHQARARKHRIPMTSVFLSFIDRGLQHRWRSRPSAWACGRRPRWRPPPSCRTSRCSRLVRRAGQSCAGAVGGIPDRDQRGQPQRLRGCHRVPGLLRSAQVLHVHVRRTGGEGRRCVRQLLPACRRATGANKHTCAGQWSGNFMNWATMQTIDPFRWALSGGYRSVDTTSETILEKAWGSTQGFSGNFPLARDRPGQGTQAARRAGFLGHAVRQLEQLQHQHLVARQRHGVHRDRQPERHGRRPARPRRRQRRRRQTDALYQVYVRVKVCDNSAERRRRGGQLRQVRNQLQARRLLQQNANKIRYSTFSFLNAGGDCAAGRRDARADGLHRPDVSAAAVHRRDHQRTRRMGCHHRHHEHQPRRGVGRGERRHCRAG